NGPARLDGHHRSRGLSELPPLRARARSWLYQPGTQEVALEYVVSGSSRTSRGPPEGGHYVLEPRRSPQRPKMITRLVVTWVTTVGVVSGGWTSVLALADRAKQ